MKLIKIALFLLAVLSLAACHPNTPPATTATVDTVATVNGAPISRNMYNIYRQGRCCRARIPAP